MYHVIIESVNLFFVGILAGGEFVVRYGLSAPMAAMDDKPHIRLRQSLIRRLRILVPSVFGLAAASGIAVLFSGGSGPGFGFRCAGLLALLAFILIALLGTVPINKGALAWQPDAPPSNWKSIIERWQRLDTFRCLAAILAFALFLAAVGLGRLTVSS